MQGANHTDQRALAVGSVLTTWLSQHEVPVHGSVGTQTHRHADSAHCAPFGLVCSISWPFLPVLLMDTMVPTRRKTFLTVTWLCCAVGFGQVGVACTLLEQSYGGVSVPLSLG